MLGCNIYIYTGGEPLVRKADIIRLCEKHQDCVFLCFTNATLIDEAFCDDIIRVANFVPAISAEGTRETTDARRGEGTYDKIDHAMDLLRARGIPFGISACWTSQNADAIASEEYFDWMIDKGALFCWLFHYMPVGAGAPKELMRQHPQRIPARRAAFPPLYGVLSTAAVQLKPPYALPYAGKPRCAAKDGRRVRRRINRPGRKGVSRPVARQDARVRSGLEARCREAMERSR